MRDVRDEPLDQHPTTHGRPNARSRWKRHSWFVIGILAAAGVGCDAMVNPREPAAAPASFADRAARRLYDGAPPVIPHAPLNIQCVACHTDTGKEAPPLGLAPANPHAQTAGLSADSHCQQCHVFRREVGVFAASDFQGLPQRFAKADRLYPGAPPVIPHEVFMRENCTSCHGGLAARAEIRCSHPKRANCRQCHVPGSEPASPPKFAAHLPEGMLLAK
jgi:cytochrome c-type protein NapB